jgi:hypothetical protein
MDKIAEPNVEYKFKEVFNGDPLFKNLINRYKIEKDYPYKGVDSYIGFSFHAIPKQSLWRKIYNNIKYLFGGFLNG